MKTIIISVKLLLVMTLITGIIYPLIIFGTGRLLFPFKTSGSLIEENGRYTGSELIGRNYDSSYFNPRPSAVNYNPLPSGGSNLGPTSRQLKNNIDSLRRAYIMYNGLDSGTVVPPDALFSSGSGLDPHISPENALLQCGRIAATRKFNDDKKNKLVELIHSSVEKPQFGFLGEPVINVVKLNAALDKL